MFKKIMIGCPVRDRAWILPSYLENLRRLDYPFDYLNYCFVINDCTDSTPELLTSFARERPDKVNLVVQNLGNRRSRNHRRGYYSFSDLAWLRNTLLTAFLKSNCDYLFSVDSDILVPPLSLSCLLEDNCAIVSALVCNGHEVGDSGAYNVFRQEDNRWIPVRDFPRDRLFEVDCTGGAYLLRRDVIDEYGVRYSSSFGAEDIGFCMDAASKGLKIFCDGKVECDHHMLER